MSEPKYGRLPQASANELVAHLRAHGGVNTIEDVYTVLWWLADNGWDIVKSKGPDE